MPNGLQYEASLRAELCKKGVEVIYTNDLDFKAKCDMMVTGQGQFRYRRPFLIQVTLQMDDADKRAKFFERGRVNETVVHLYVKINHALTEPLAAARMLRVIERINAELVADACVEQAWYGYFVSLDARGAVRTIPWTLPSARTPAKTPPVSPPASPMPTAPIARTVSLGAPKRPAVPAIGFYHDAKAISRARRFGKQGVIAEMRKDGAMISIEGVSYFAPDEKFADLLLVRKLVSIRQGAADESLVGEEVWCLPLQLADGLVAANVVSIHSRP